MRTTTSALGPTNVLKSMSLANVVAVLDCLKTQWIRTKYRLQVFRHPEISSFLQMIQGHHCGDPNTVLGEGRELTKRKGGCMQNPQKHSEAAFLDVRGSRVHKTWEASRGI